MGYKYTAIDRQGLAGARTLALDKLEEGSSGSQGVRTSKEAVYSRRPAGPLLYTNNGKTGFFIRLRWLIGFFLPQHIRGFLPVNLQVSPVYGVVCVGQ